MEAYGAWGEKQRYGKTTVGVLRSTFLIDEQGRVQRAWYNVKATATPPRCSRRSQGQRPKRPA